MRNRRYGTVFGCLALLGLVACGSGEAGQQRENRSSGRVSDNTRLAPGANQKAGPDAKAAPTGPVRPFLRDVVVNGNFAYVATPRELVILNVVADEPVAVLGRAALPAEAGRVAVSGVHVLIACDTNGLQIVSVAKPTKPEPVSVYAPEAGGVTAVAASATLAVCVVPGSGATVVDLTEPARPAEQKQIPLKGALRDVLLAGPRAYVLGDALHVLEVAKPREAKALGAYQVKAKLAAVTGLGEFTALLSDQWLQLVNLRSPERPLRSAELTLAALAEAVTPAPTVETPAEPTSIATATAATGEADTTSMADAEEVEPTPATETAEPAASPAPAEPLAPLPPVTLESRLVATGDRLFVLHDGLVDVLALVEAKTLKPLYRLLDAPPVSCLAVAGRRLLLGTVEGELLVYELGETGARRVSGLSLKPAELPAAGPTLELTGEQAARLEAVPEPSNQRPKGAPAPS